MSTIIIYDYVTPAYKAGGPTQSIYNLITNLATYPLQVLATNKDLDGSTIDVSADKWLHFEDTQTKVWYASETSLPLVKEMVKEVSVLFINSIFSHHFNYVSLIRSKAKRIIVSPRGMLDAGSLSQKSWKKKIYLTYWKLLGIHKRCEWHATNEQEKNNIQQVFGTQSKVWVVPNFPRCLPHQAVSKKPQQLKLITVALISPMKNHLLVLKALSIFTIPISYDIYGPIKDKDYWQACQEVIAGLPSNITVSYKGELPPHLLEEALQSVQVCIQPSKSENFGHSLFEAMTAGKPIITSHHTPWNQLSDNRAGVNVDIQNTTEIEQAIRFFAAMDESEWQLWNESCRQYALSKIDIPAIKKGYLQMFENS